jgi:hypothetical protein
MADTGASGTPATDGVKSEQTNVPTAGVVGLDPVAVQEELRKAFNDIEAIMQRIEARLSFHEDIGGLRGHLQNARDWVAEKLGLDKHKDGTFHAPAGSVASQETSTGSTDKTNPNSNTASN